MSIYFENHVDFDLTNKIIVLCLVIPKCDMRVKKIAAS